MSAPHRQGNGCRSHSATSLSDQLEQIFAAEDALDLLASARASARHTRFLRNGWPTSFAAVSLAVSGLVELAVDRAVEEDVFSAVVEATAAATDIPADTLSIELCRWAVGHPRLLAFPPHRALRAQLRLTRAAPPLSEISLWRQGDAGPEWILSVGEQEPTQAVSREACRLLSTGGSTDSRKAVQAVAVTRWHELHAVLVARAPRCGIEDRCMAVLDAAAAAVEPVLEKDTLLRRSVERERVLVESTERRFTRLGLDLHDGAVQDLAVLAEDVRLLRRQLGSALEGSDHEHILLGRIDDVEARLLSLDDELRGLARSFESPSFLKRPLREVLERELGSFSRRTDIEATLDVRGDLSQTTVSQRIALVRIVQESLANVREHSGASEVEVSVVATGGAVQAAIRDNGCGFAVERTLMRAARRGRLGLVGMSERVRLLGGGFDVESARGGPTTISVTLPEWRPLSGETASAQRRRHA
jgi:signal transduction histidine kinase